MITGKAGPNAVFKIVVPSHGRSAGHVLSVARHPTTSVITHEADVLTRLAQVLPERWRGSVPRVEAGGKVDGHDYFAVPFVRSYTSGRVARWLVKRRRCDWVAQWTTAVARATRGVRLSRSWLDEEYHGPLKQLLCDPTVTTEVKEQVQASFETIREQAEQIPSVCCHGDLWFGNILWQRAARGAVVIDWGAARWPGLPAVDLCRYLFGNVRSDGILAEAIRLYCRAVDLSPSLVPALYDLYTLFVKAELDLAFANQPQRRINPFSDVYRVRAERLRRCVLTVRESTLTAGDLSRRPVAPATPR